MLCDMKAVQGTWNARKPTSGSWRVTGLQAIEQRGLAHIGPPNDCQRDRLDVLPGVFVKKGYLNCEKPCCEPFKNILCKSCFLTGSSDMPRLCPVAGAVVLVMPVLTGVLVQLGIWGSARQHVVSASHVQMSTFNVIGSMKVPTFASYVCGISTTSRSHGSGALELVGLVTVVVVLELRIIVASQCHCSC